MAAVPRRPLNLFAALSPLLCVTVTALWVRSYWTSDRLDYQGERKLYSAVVHVGTLQFVHVDRDSTRVPVGFSHHASQVQPGETWSSTWNRPSTVRGRLGFGIVRGGYYRLVILPLWLASLASAALAIHCVRLGHELRRRPK